MGLPRLPCRPFSALPQCSGWGAANDRLSPIVNEQGAYVTRTRTLLVTAWRLLGRRLAGRPVVVVPETS